MKESLTLSKYGDFEENFKPCWRKPAKEKSLAFIFISQVTRSSLNNNQIVELARLSGLCRCQMLASDFQWLN